MTVKVCYKADKIKEISGYTVTVLYDGDVLIKFEDVDEIIKYTSGGLAILYNGRELITLKDYDFFSVKA